MIPDYCDDDLSGCMRQFCQDQSTEDPGGLFIANDPTGTGGQALNCNFITLQYRQARKRCREPFGGRPRGRIVFSSLAIGSVSQ
jgi:hypothetical protein